MTGSYFLAIILMMGFIFTIYKYYKTLQQKYLLIGWGLFIIDMICLNIGRDKPFMGLFISDLSVGLIIFVIPIGFYHFRKGAKEAKTQPIRESVKSGLIALSCLLIISFTTPINQCFEKIARNVSSEYNNQKTKEENQKEVQHLVFSREWSFKTEAQMAVLQCLKAPNTAKFDLYEEYYRNPDTNEWIYVGTISSQNDFGAFLTKQYVAFFSSDGKYLIGIKFEDNVIPFNKKVSDWEKWGPKLNGIEENRGNNKV